MSRNKCNLSNYRLATCDFGQLIPVGCVPVLPGDTVQHHVNLLIRVQPLMAPAYHPIYARCHSFFVPNRLVFNDGDDDTNGTWEDFITGGPDGLNAEAPPVITTTGTAKDMLDYMGIPLVAGIDVNAMPIRAVNKVFNDYYRDQDLVTERDLDDLTIPRIAWEKDYFTAARPWTQKGADVTIPLGASAPIEYNTGVGNAALARKASDDSLAAAGAYAGAAGGVFTTAGAVNSYWDPNGTLYADLAAATGANVNDVRRAFAIQRYQEARARYGSRYTEYLRYMGVRNPADSRLQRPEFLGGGTSPLQISEVMNTATTQYPAAGQSMLAPVGGLGGHGIAANRTNKYRRFIEEHGYIVTLFSIRPKSIYVDGIHREFLRTTKEDFFQKELQFIGQQEIYNNEVYADAASGGDVFGYGDRYQEYTEHPSQVTSEFRSSLDHWHLGRDFSSAPTLNGDFVTCTPADRIFAITTQNEALVMAQHKMVARRLVKPNAAPRII